MHHHLEVIMPPTDDIEKALEVILKPFDSNKSSASGKEKFWDWYVIGGRYAGSKFEAQFDEEKIQEFYEWLKSEHITVSGFQAGKQSLEPSDQIPKVDAKWNEMFPSVSFVPCPLFAHSKHENTPGDVMRFSDVPKRLKAARVIVARQAWKYSQKTKSGRYIGRLEAETMFSDDFYNGVSWLTTDWDGNVHKVVEKHNGGISEKCDEEVKKAHLVTDDWLVVTVDCHN